MGLDVQGVLDLENDLANMADALISFDYGNGTSVAAILATAAEPIKVQMCANATADPVVRSGKLRGSIKISPATKGSRGNLGIKIGITAKGGAFYANPVEFGHGGPHPAPPHPFVRPAFDAKKDEAYEIIRAQLNELLAKRGGL